MSAREGPGPTSRGLPFDEAASMLQKTVRRGQTDLAVRVAVDLAESGYVAYVWRRCFVICTEDVGLANPHLPATYRERVMALHGQKAAT